MQTEEPCKSKSAQRSLTDRILTLCASGRFGVREAVAAAARRIKKPQGSLAQQQEQQKAG